MDGATLTLLGLLCALFSLGYYLVERFRTSRRKTNGALTPPSSVHEKTPKVQPSNNEIFPPHRREALARLSTSKSMNALSQLPPDYSKLTPDKTTCNKEDFSHHTTATGFAVGEIQSLGDFPDYETLSGLPLPSVHSNFDIKTALSRPYRPYRWPYFQTMSLTKLEPDFWLELDKNYASVISQRQDLFAKYGPKVLRGLPGSELAAKELMEMCLQFLCARYPQYFNLDKDRKVLHNAILNTDTDLKATEPLHVLLHNIPEDFAIMIRDPETGTYSFRGGVIMSSLGWDLGSKIGLKLHEIHAPIPDFREKMQFSMDRYFAKMPTEKGIQRGSWGLEVDQPLYMPPGDPHEKYRDIQDPAFTVDRCHLRVDWQTLRRLPLSGAIVFNFKALFTPVTEFRDEPYIPSLVLKVLREGPKNIMEYKNTWHTEHVAVPALEQYEREQIEKGLIPRDWEESTLDESPFFPGWQEKWHRQQGFQ